MAVESVTAKRTIRTPEKDTEFFTAVSAGHPIGVAAESAGYARRSIYEWRDADEDFAKRWSEANERAIERMEEEADRRAVDGIDKPVHYQGERVDVIREFSDTLLIFRLKAKRPGVYRENQHVQFDGTMRAAVIQDQPPTAEEWEKQHGAKPLPSSVNGNANGNGSTNGHGS